MAADLRDDRIAVGQATGWDAEKDLLAGTDPPVYLVVEVTSDLMPPRDHLLAVRKATGVPGTYAGLYGDHLYAVSDDIDAAALSDLLIEANDAGETNDETEAVLGFIERADKLNGGSAVSAPEEEGGSGFFDALGWILIPMGLIAVGILVITEVASRRFGGVAAGGPLGTSPAAAPPRAFGPGTRRRRWDQVAAQETWEESERLDDAWVRAEEAITRLGEGLSALGVDLADDRVETAIRQHVTDALHGYELAKRSLEMEAARQTQLATAEAWIKDGEYHLASANAVLTGAPEPTPPRGHRPHPPR